MTPATSSTSAIAVWILLSLYFVFLVYACRHYVEKLRTEGVSFTYSILDIWAAILGLTPSLLLLGNFFARREPDLNAWLLAIFFAGAQCAGIVLARTDFLLDCAAKRAQEHPLSSAGSVLLGAWVYSVTLIAAFVVAFYLLPATVVALLYTGIGRGVERHRSQSSPPGDG